jgi:hypothetical protein
LESCNPRIISFHSSRRDHRRSLVIRGVSRNWDGETHALGFRLATPEVKLSAIKARHLRALLPGRMELGNVYRRDAMRRSGDARKQSQTSVAFYCPERCERVVLPYSRDQPRRSELFHSDSTTNRPSTGSVHESSPWCSWRLMPKSFRRRPGPGGSVKRSAQSATSCLVAQQIETKLVLRDRITAVWFELWGDGYQGRAERFDFGPHVLQSRQLRICSRVTICIGRNLLRPAPL